MGVTYRTDCVCLKKRMKQKRLEDVPKRIYGIFSLTSLETLTQYSISSAVFISCIKIPLNLGDVFIVGCLLPLTQANGLHTLSWVAYRCFWHCCNSSVANVGGSSLFSDSYDSSQLSIECS